MRAACRSSILQLAWARGGKNVPRYFQWARTAHLWRSCPPHPPPSPQGEGELSATLRAKGDPISLGARTAPSPWGEGTETAGKQKALLLLVNPLKSSRKRKKCNPQSVSLERA